jgi:hypothetical protein
MEGPAPLDPACNPHADSPNNETGLQSDSGDLSRSMETLMPKPYVFVLLGFSLVDLARFELATSSMPWKRAPNCATGPSVRKPSITYARRPTN